MPAIEDVAPAIPALPEQPIAVLSFSRLARDRRVMRQCELLRSLGEEPLAIAYAEVGDHSSFHLESRQAPKPTTAHRLAVLVRQLPAHLGLRSARAGFWAASRHRWALATLRRRRPRLVLANDWPALVVAAAYKAESGAKIHYDSHEFATLEFDEHAYWRLVYKPMVTKLEHASIYSADSISTVGQRLAEAMQARYGLADQPVVIRNIPRQIALPPVEPTSWPLRLLYHGQLLPDRGLETLISTVPLWRVPHRLTIRGDGAESYISALKRQAHATGRSDLISFVPAVPPDEVMPVAARSADVGVHFTPLDTDQRHFSMPNKLFEYIGAGLAAAVTPGADLKRLIEVHNVGVCARDASVIACAEVIDSLTQDRVTELKANARLAAETLCWEAESLVLARVLRQLLLGTN